MNNITITDFYTTCFLKISGFRLITINRDNPRRFGFVFEDREDRAKLLEDFYNGRARVDPRIFVTVIKEMKSLMYSETF